MSTLPTTLSNASPSDVANTEEEKHALSVSDWTQVIDFITKSKETDPFVYALTRKEAHLQKCFTAKTREHINIIELWHLRAVRFLMGGKLLCSPKLLENKTVSDGSLIFDLKGAYGSKLAWQVALDFPNALVYSFEVLAGSDEDADEKKIHFYLSSSANSSGTATPNVRPSESYADQINFGGMKNVGPPNYIPCSGHSLQSLPFDDDTFDVVRASSFWYQVLKKDWDKVFLELLRITKPGGFIEIISFDIFTLNDNNSSHPYWKRLTDGLETAGYDSHYSATLPQSLYKAGYENVQRALLALPWGWGGQAGIMSDFICLHQMESLFKAFLNISQAEFEAFKRAAEVSSERGLHPAHSLSFVYASKPHSSAETEGEEEESQAGLGD